MDKNDWIAFAGWSGLIIYAAVWDVFSVRTRKVETLSTGFRKASRHKIARWIVIPGTILLLTHLFFKQPI
jgi:hypothetical protein